MEFVTKDKSSFQLEIIGKQKQITETHKFNQGSCNTPFDLILDFDHVQ